jgi:hypothetical protein
MDNGISGSPVARPLTQTRWCPKDYVHGQCERVHRKEHRISKSRAAGSHTISTEPHTQKHNLAEAGIRELKRKYKKLKRKTNSPKAVWDHLMMYASLLLSHTARNITELEGQTPETMIMGSTPDISKLVEFEWYQWVWFGPDTDRLPKKIRPVPGKPGKIYQDHEYGSDQYLDLELGRYLGPSFEVGEGMSMKILTKVGTVAVRTSILPMSQQEMDLEDHRRLRDDWSQALKEKLRDRVNPTTQDEDERLYHFAADYQMAHDKDLEDGEEPVPEADDVDYAAFDKFLQSQVLLPKGDETKLGRVVKRQRDENGNLLGKSNDNPLLNTAVYEVEFEDGIIEAYAANTIAESIYANTDDNGLQELHLETIMDYEADETAVPKSHGWCYPDKGENKQRVKTTKG